MPENKTAKKNKDNKDSKLVILYHRSYRKLPGSTRRFLFQFVFFALPLSLLTILFYPYITEQICILTKNVLTPYFYEGSLTIFSREYIEPIGPIYYIDLPESFPTLIFSLFNAVLTIIGLIVLPRINNSLKPFFIFVTFMLVVHLVSSLYFIVVPEHFPYTAADYSVLYMLQEISIWFFVPIIMGLAILPLPAGVFLKIFTLVFIYVYSMVFGVVRYILFLLIISKVSMIYMGILFFALGPLIDFIYITGTYTLFVNYIAQKTGDDFSVWRWQS